jgi:hypothetical protein
MQHYRSNHPNHAHQLVASVSKHYYAGKDGLLKYQVKPMETSLTKLSSASKKHMVIYSLRDHFSAVFYAEIGFGPELPPLHAFLTRAWGTKSHMPEFPFHGVPELLTFPQTARVAFPEVVSAVETLGVSLVAVTSGFQGGVGDLNTIEKWLGYHVGKPLEQAVAWLPNVCVFNAREKLRNTGRRKIDVWMERVPAVRMLPAQWMQGVDGPRKTL